MVKQNRHFSFFAIILMVLMTSYSCEKMDESEKGAQSPDKIKAQQENAIKKFLDKRPQFTTAADRLAGFEQRRALQENSLLSQVAFRNVGPSIMSGRVVDIDVDPRDAAHFYVAYASGGLWETKNNGITFVPLFDNEAVMSIGDIAVDWLHGNTIWVGTGENNSSRSSYSGTGIYKSENDGKTWQHLGLAETHHIGRIVLNPGDPEMVWVAAIGHLYSDNTERGVFKTSNGGKSWEKTLYIDEKTGVIDLVQNSQNTNILYAASWHRERYAWDFVESGATSGIYKSLDAGDTWHLLTTKESGFPTGNGVGRIGLDVSLQNPQIVYAVLDNQFRREKDEDDDAPELTKDSLRTMSSFAFLALDDKDIDAYLDYYGFPQKYAAKSVKEQVRQNKIQPEALVSYLEDANTQLFDTPVIGGEVYVSHDGGQSWSKTHDQYLDNFVYSYGYYFGQIRVSPMDSNKIYILGVPALKSEDGGKSFTALMADNLHGDHHALWIDPRKPDHLINGNDGGINITYDEGTTWFKANNPPVGQFYTVNVDMAKPYNVYGGLQDNGVWYGPSTYEAGFSWQSSGSYPYKRLLGGDGMQVAIDTRDNNTIYTGFQFGYYYKVNKQTGQSSSVKPQHDLGERPPRFNWQSPVHISIHNQDIFYIGAEKLYRSMQGGEMLIAISGDLTQGGLTGDVPYGTLTSIDESPKRFGLIYVGSDDGLIHVTQDGGYSWQRISDDLPQNLWISRVEASPHEESVVFATLNGYRFDDFSAYLYKSSDYGKTWERLGTDLPAEPLNVVVQDPENANILYVGSDHGLYTSIDGGKSFMALYKNLPAVAVHDLVVHPREKDLVVGTHGRSIYIANIEHVQQLTDSILSETTHFFPVEPITWSKRWGKKRSMWDEPETPKIEIAFYLKKKADFLIQIQTESGMILTEWTHTGVAGLNYTDYDLSIDVEKKGTLRTALHDKNPEADPVEIAENGKLYLREGTYKIVAKIDGKAVESELKIEAPKKKKRGE